MGRSSNALGSYPGAGCFATARRAHIDGLEIERLHRRGVGVQNISQQLGCSMEDVRRILAPPPAQTKPDAANDDAAPVIAAAKSPRFSGTAEEAKFRELWLSDMGRAEIMSSMGISYRRMSALRKNLRLPARPSGRRPASAA